jgi:phospholipid/cholesterol/gamma-HCH transport system substrate-binding protein
VKRLLKLAKTASPFKAGLIGVILIVAVTYGAYTKFSNPFASPYTIHAIVPNANELRPQSLVRIAGVNVGKVTSISPSCKGGPPGSGAPCSAADVTMTIDNNGLPIHKDASFWIRPRIFLEGNFFVDLNPGTPEAPVAPSGWVFPIQQTREPVQFGQLLTSLQSDTRSNLRTLLQQYGLAVYQGGPAYNASITYWKPAYQWGAAVSHDTLGEQPHDLSGWIDKAGVVNGALSAHPQNLKNLVTDLDTTALAFARENTALQNAVAELPHTLQVAIPALIALDRDLCSGPQPGPPNCPKGPLPRFADALIPAAKSTPALVDNALPFFHQLRLLVSPSELGGCPTPGAPLKRCGLTANLSSAIPALAKLNAYNIPFMRDQVRAASSCQVNVILPWSHLEIHDSHFNSSNGFPARPVYVEGVDYLPGLAGESRDFDANGPYVRILGTGGSLTYSLQPGLFGTELQPILGEEPTTPPLHNSGDGAPAEVSRPPLKETTPCENQPQISEAELNSAQTGPAPQPVQTTQTPAGLALDRSAALIELQQMVTDARQQGLSVHVPSNLGKLVGLK